MGLKQEGEGLGLGQVWSLTAVVRGLRFMVTCQGF